MDDNTANQDVLEKLSLNDLPEARKNEILAQLDQLVEAQVALAISEKLDEATQQKLDDLVDNGTPEQVLEVIKQNIPDYDAMVTKIAENTINELANNKDAVLAEVERMRTEEAPASTE